MYTCNEITEAYAVFLRSTVQSAYVKSFSESLLLLPFPVFIVVSSRLPRQFWLVPEVSSNYYAIGHALLSLNRHSCLLLPAYWTLPVAYCSVYYCPGAFSSLSYWCEVFFILGGT